MEKELNETVLQKDKQLKLLDLLSKQIEKKSLKDLKKQELADRRWNNLKNSIEDLDYFDQLKVFLKLKDIYNLKPISTNLYNLYLKSLFGQDL